MHAFLISALSFVVAIGVLITVHEFGHFWVARRLGVKVLRFSIGFGKPLWMHRSRRDQTEYAIAAIPLGGYVKMLDEHEGEVPQEDLPRAFNRQPVWKRSAIVVAGPLFNFLFAILAYWGVFVTGIEGTRPIVGQVTVGSIAAQGGLTKGDEIFTVGGQHTPTWDSASLALLDAAMEGVPVTLEVHRKGRDRAVRLDTTHSAKLLEGTFILQALGIQPYRPPIPAIIDRVVPGGAAERAGFKAGDKVTAAGGQPIDNWAQWVEFVRNRPDKTFTVTVERDGRSVDLRLTPGAVTQAGRTFGRIGAYGRIPADLLAGLRAEVRYGPVEALTQSVHKTVRMSALMLLMLGKMVVGQASIENISGPISIAQYAGESASIGLVPFITFLAVISISLGIINVLPVPLLDGGHLLYYVIELVKGSPVSETAQMVGQKMGILVLLALMGVAFYNDLMRLFG